MHGSTPFMRNYTFNLIGGGLLFVALQFGNMRLVVPWIDAQLGVAYILVALVVPVSQFGLIVAQLGIAPLIPRVAVRRKVVVWLSLVLALAVLVVFTAVTGLAPQAAALLLLVCALAYGVAHGAFNIAYEDLLAKTIPAARRATLVANRATLGGILTLLISAIVLIFVPEDEDNQARLLWLAVIGWLGVAAAYAGLNEPPSAPIHRRFSPDEFTRGYRLIGIYPWFQRVLIAQTLLLSVELAIPFYAIHAAALHDPSAQNLSVFVVATGIGVISSGLLWASFSAEARMAVGALLALLAGALTLVVEGFDLLGTPYFHAFVFALLTVGEQGAIQGHMVFMTNHAPAEDRPALIATSYATMRILGVGVALLLGAAGHLQDIRAPLVLLIIFNAAAALYVMTNLRPSGPMVQVKRDGT
jgi:MFS family permease